MERLMQELVGKKIKEILWDFEYGYQVAFVTDSETFVYQVDGDCCSYSYIYDFYGVKSLLENGPITEVYEIEPDAFNKDYQYIQCYGYGFVTNNPRFGEVTSVFSFRNESNGYYGGSISRVTEKSAHLKPIHRDINCV